VPDPTALTATAVSQAKDDLRRELASSRELLGERISRLEAIIHDLDERLKADIVLSSESLRDVTAQRLDGFHAELRIYSQTLDRVEESRGGLLAGLRSESDGLRERLQGEITDAVEHLQRLHEERFAAIAQQFTERDVRSEQEKKAAKEALDAALLAQKESVSQQNDANTTAATKSETSFTKQIDQIATLIATLEKALTDRITELKERIDRGEGTTAGAGTYRTERRLDLGAILAAFAILVSLATVLVVAFKP